MILLVYSMRRSGHHAIINWICKQKRPAVHLDDGKFDGKILNSSGHVKYSKDGNNEKGRKKEINIESESEFDLILLNFEDKEFKRYKTNVKITYAIITRDPYNWLASRHKQDLHVAKPIKRTDTSYIKMWKNHISLCGEKDILDINFNKWFSNIEYRKKLAEILNMEFTDDGLNEVAKTGYGSSSFDRSSYNTKAQSMKVLERWKNFNQDEKYRAIFKDKELTKIAIEYFNFNIEDV